MKIFGTGHFLGMTFGDRSIGVAEIGPRGGGGVRTAEYVFPPGSPADDPEAQGRALAEFLRHQGFVASRGIAGIPARWLLAKSREIPPMPPALAGEALRMSAERDLSMDLEDLVLDYAGQASEREPRRVLLVAVLARQLDRIVRICRGAGIRLLAATSATLILARAEGEDFGDGVLVSLVPGAAEVLVQTGGLPSALRHIALKPGAEGLPESLTALGNEIRRMLSLLPGAQGKGDLRILDAVGLDPAMASGLAERAGLPLAAAGGDGLSRDPAGGEPPVDGGPAGALALAGIRRDLVAVDFLHSRCAAPKKSRMSRKTVVPVAVAAVAALAALLLFIDLGRREADLTVMRNQIQDMAADIKEAEDFVKNNKSLVMGWYDARPHPLDLLKQVTLAFPEEGKVWATSFTATDGKKGTLSGKATDQKSVLMVLDKLKADTTLSDVMLSDIREAAGKSEVIFALTFTYQAPE